MSRTAEQLIHGGPVLCRACKRGEHRYCTMSRHCECRNLEDGDCRDRDEFEAYYDRLDKEDGNGSL